MTSDPNAARQRRRALRSEAQKFLIWRHADALNWEVTASDIAAALSISARRVKQLCAEAGWLGRLRTDLVDNTGNGSYMPDIERAITTGEWT